MASYVYLDDICRLCLNSNVKENTLSLIKITETFQVKFQEVTQQNLSLSHDYPENVCGECSDTLENFYFYKNLLLTKQTQLDEFLKSNQFKTEVQEELISVADEETYCFPNVDATNSDIEVIEEYLYDNDTQEFENEEQYELNVDVPMIDESVNSNILQSKEKDLVELIEEIEQRNKTIFEGSSFIPPKASRTAITQQVVCRIDSLKVQTPVPKLILGLKTDGDSTHAVEVLYNQEYSCFICPETFTSKSQLKQHNGLIHFKRPTKSSLLMDHPMMCEVCQKVLKNKKSLSVHMRTHDSTRKFPCMFPGCNKGFNMKLHLENHLRTHTGDRPFVCNFDNCEASFKQSYLLTLHTRKHNGVRYDCSMCQSQFVSTTSLKKHETRCDGVYRDVTKRGNWRYSIKTETETEQIEKSYQCAMDLCYCKFRTKASLHKHLTSIHNLEVTDQTCILCCKDFENSHLLRFHNSEHHTKTNTCPECKLGFKSIDALKNHTQKQHTRKDSRPYTCDVCGAKFKRLEHMNSHLQYKHNPGNRPFKCDLCDFAAPFRWDLKNHLSSTHSEERPHHCKFCDFAAKKINSLRSHLRQIHQSNEVFTCHKCEESFEYLDQFNEHKKMHG